MTVPVVAPERLVGLLAEQRRLRVFAAVVLGAQTPTEVMERTGLTLREVAEALRRLSEGGLVSSDPPLVARDEAFAESARTAAATRPVAEPLDPDRARAAVLAAVAP